MQSVGKVVTAIATLGTVGGIGAGSYYALNNSQDIKGRLEAEKFTLLTSSSTNEEWTAVLNKYKTESTHTFTGKADNGSDVNVNYLKEKCAQALSKKINDTSNYKLAKRWCVKEETVNTILERRGYIVLDVSVAKSEEANAWKTNLDELKKDITKFDAVKNTIKKQDEATDVAALKEGCKTLQTGTIKTTDDKFEENIELASQWCSSKKQNGK